MGSTNGYVRPKEATDVSFHSHTKVKRTTAVQRLAATEDGVTKEMADGATAKLDNATVTMWPLIWHGHK